MTAVNSVAGTTNRITVSPTTGATIVNISPNYVGQTTITTLGTITVGAVPASLITAGTFPAGAFAFTTSVSAPILTVGASLTGVAGFTDVGTPQFSKYSTTNQSADFVGGPFRITRVTEATISLRYAKNTIAAPAFPGNLDDIGEILFQGWDTSDYVQAAAVGCQATEAWAAGKNGAMLDFKVTAAGTTGMVNVFSMTEDGLASTVSGGSDIGTAAAPCRTGRFGTSVIVGAEGTNPLAGATKVYGVVNSNRAANPGQVNLARADTTLAAPSAVQSGDVIGLVNFYGYGSSEYLLSASIGASAAENFGANYGSNLLFATVAVGTATYATRFVMNETAFRPFADDTYQNGLSGRRWSTVWGMAGSFATSLSSPILQSGAATNLLLKYDTTTVLTVGSASVLNAQDYDTASGKVYKVNGTQVVGAQQAHIADPTGGLVVDAEARTAIAAINALCATHGLTAAS
jgi:hypothetical protein